MEIFKRKYQILIHNTKKDWTGDNLVNIESDDLDYVDWPFHEGLQCMTLPGTKEYETIREQCRIINQAFKIIEKLNEKQEEN